MIKLVRVAPAEKIRIWGAGDRLPSGQVVAASELAIEWTGRLGHPSSYGMLAGHLAPTTSFDANVLEDDLPHEYRAAVGAGASLTISYARHDLVSSSAHVFRSLTTVLAQALDDPSLSSDPERLWQAWDAAFAS